MPQTSGGLLVDVEGAELEAFFKTVKEHGFDLEVQGEHLVKVI